MTPSYGYRVSGLDGNAALMFHEPEAKIIGLILTWYVCGNGEEVVRVHCVVGDDVCTLRPVESLL